MSAPDILDILAGVAPGSALDALRRARPETRLHVQASYEALFAPRETAGPTAAERFAIAAFVALLHRDAAAIGHYLAPLEIDAATAPLAAALRRQAARAETTGPYGAYPAGPLTAENAEGPDFAVDAADAAVIGLRLTAALAHVHQLVFHPRDAAADDFVPLRQAGWSTAEIVTLSQIVAFLSFQLRAAHGLRALAA